MWPEIDKKKPRNRRVRQLADERGISINLRPSLEPRREEISKGREDKNRLPCFVLNEINYSTDPMHTYHDSSLVPDQIDTMIG